MEIKFTIFISKLLSGRKIFTFYEMFLCLSLLFIVSCHRNIPKISAEIKPESTSVLTSSNDCEVQISNDGGSLIFVSVVSAHLADISFDVITDMAHQVSLLYPGICQISLNEHDHKNAKLTVNIYENKNLVSTLPINVKIKHDQGRKIFCDPSTKSMGEGTRKNPFPSLQKLMETGFKPQKGDVIYLLDGPHGDVVISGSDFTVTPFKDAKARLNSLEIQSSSNITFSGIHIGSRMPNKPNLIFIDSLSNHIHVSNCHIGSDIKDDELSDVNWRTFVATGIFIQGDHINITNNLLQNTFHAIQIDGNDNTFSCNIVDRFCGDAIRNTGDANVYSHNFISNALIDDYYDPKGNHDDMFQAWTHDRPIKSIKVVDNIAISILDPALPNKSKVVQGIVCFDGFTENWTIADNIVYTDHPHGIALYGAKNCTVENNVVLRHPMKYFDFESNPWIMIHDHKDKRKSNGNVLKDNKAAVYKSLSDGTQMSGNVILDSINQQKIYKIHGWNQ